MHSSHVFSPNQALVTKHDGICSSCHIHVHTHTHSQTHTNTQISQYRLCSCSQPLCQSDKAITLKGLAPWEFNHLFSFSSYLPLSFFTGFPSSQLIFYHSWRLIPQSIHLYASLFTNELCYTCMPRHSCTVWEGTRGGDIKAAHIQSTDATCAEGQHTPLIRESTST